MPRVKRGNKRRLKRKKILRRAKGYYLAKSKLYRIAKQQVERSLNFAFRDYTPFGAYGQAKTANVLFAVGATARWERDGIYANALHPGGIATNLQRHTGPELIEQALKNGLVLKTPEQGAATSVVLAARPEFYAGRCQPQGGRARSAGRRAC